MENLQGDLGCGILQFYQKNYKKMVLSTHHMCGNPIVSKKILLMIILLGNLHLENIKSIKNLTKNIKSNLTQSYSLVKPLTSQCYHQKCSNSPS